MKITECALCGDEIHADSKGKVALVDDITHMDHVANFYSNHCKVAYLVALTF